MSEQTTDGLPPGSGTGTQPPAGGEQQQQQQAAPAARPEWLPENHWDPEKNTIKEDFGQHYTNMVQVAERQAALASRKPEDIKFEVKLPPEVKAPDGMKLTIDEKDPRIPVLREMAIEHGLDQPVIDKLVAMDAKLKIEQHAAEVARVKAEDAKLGANGNDRKKAISTWADGLKAKGELSPGEYSELQILGATADGVTLIEKLIAKANGSVPGTQPGRPQTPAQVPQADRWYATTTAKKVS